MPGNFVAERGMKSKLPQHPPVLEQTIALLSRRRSHQPPVGWPSVVARLLCPLRNLNPEPSLLFSCQISNTESLPHLSLKVSTLSCKLQLKHLLLPPGSETPLIIGPQQAHPPSSPTWVTGWRFTGSHPSFLTRLSNLRATFLLAALRVQWQMLTEHL